ncbi:MAG: hypothetical protein J1G30_10225, partial [Spirochaetales bacterium]|nr:hypothetical protein [Spirochaetales bacterium]
SLRSINKVFSGLIGKNFFTQINQFTFEVEFEKDEIHDDVKKTTIRHEDYKIYQKIEELYSLRPFITHDQPEKSIISEFQVQNYLSAANLFAFVIDNYLKELIQNNLKELADVKRVELEEEEEFLKEEEKHKFFRSK